MSKWTSWMMMTLIAGAALAVTACPAAQCEDGEQQCSGDQVQTCADGQWGEATDCDAGQACMTMDSGVEHCMESM